MFSATKKKKQAHDKTKTHQSRSHTHTQLSHSDGQKGTNTHSLNRSIVVIMHIFSNCFLQHGETAPRPCEPKEITSDLLRIPNIHNK